MSLPILWTLLPKYPEAVHSMGLSHTVEYKWLFSIIASTSAALYFYCVSSVLPAMGSLQWEYLHCFCQGPSTDTLQTLSPCDYPGTSWTHSPGLGGNPLWKGCVCAVFVPIVGVKHNHHQQAVNSAVLKPQASAHGGLWNSTNFQ